MGLVLDTGGERSNWREGRDQGQEDLTVRESCDFGEPPLCFIQGRYTFRSLRWSWKMYLTGTRLEAEKPFWSRYSGPGQG